MFGYSREAVRVKVKKCEGKLQPELRKFSVDPQITSLEVLQSILTKAFDIKSDFTISYKTVDDFGNEIHLPLLSDWDLDAAFLKAHNISINQRCEPCVQLKVDMKPFAEASEDWEPSNIITNANINQNESIYSSNSGQAEMKQPQTGFQGLFMTQVEKTLSMVTRALNLYDDPTLPPRAPLNDAEFRTYLDPVGHIVHSSKLREVIYCGGIEPSLRKVVWKHILNVYPDGMTGKERMDYMKKKATEYYTLRNSWKDSIQKGQVNNNLAYVTSMVRKDVLRTDRHHKFYAGSDDNQNIASLFNILTTYALNHPLVSYCQGMSDLASPLMVTMGDEAHAYICFCALMCRLHPNFLLNGEAMTLKFTHLAESLQAYDADFYAYLKSQQADDLLFCYRWLLLEMKREFAFEDSLRMLEVLWSSLPPKPPECELALKEKEFDPSMTVEDGEPPPMSPLNKTLRENAYTKVCSIRRQSSTFSLVNIASNKMSTYKHMNHSLDENASRKGLNNISLKNAKGFQSLDDAALQLSKQNPAKFDCLKKNIRDLNQGCNNKNLHKTLSINRNNSLKKKVEDRNTIMENGQHLKADDMKHFSSSTGNLPNGRINADSLQNTSPLGNQIRDLRQKITQSNKFFSSLDKLDYNTCSAEDYENSNKPKMKMIKNLNEFLNFTSGNNTKLKQDKLLRTQSVVENSNVCENPSITVTKTSFDENDLQSYQKGSRECKNQTNPGEKIFDTEYNDGSSPDDSQEYYPMTTSMTRELRLELEHLDRQVFGADYTNRNNFPLPSDSASDSVSIEEKATTAECDCVVSKKELEVTDYSDTQIEIAEIVSTPKMRQVKDASNKMIVKSTDDIYLWENPLHKNCLNVKGPASYPQTPDEQAELEYDGDTGEIFEETSGKKSITPIRLLRKPQPVHIKDHEHINKNSSESDISDVIVNAQEEQPQIECESGTARPHSFFSSMSQELENARKNCETILVTKQSPNLQSIATTITNFQKKYDALKPQMKNHLLSGNNMVGPIACEEVTEVSSKWTVNSLPPPNVFGGGNPFLMFLCLTVLLQHRDFIMRNHMDYNELAMHFDKMVRKHNVNRVLNQARQMYAMYLKQQAANSNDINT